MKTHLMLVAQGFVLPRREGDLEVAHQEIVWETPLLKKKKEYSNALSIINLHLAIQLTLLFF